MATTNFYNNRFIKYSINESEERYELDGELIIKDVIDLYSDYKSHMKHMLILFKSDGYRADPPVMDQLGSIEDPIWHVRLTRIKAT